MASLAAYLSTFCDIDSGGEGMDVWPVWRLIFLLSVISTVNAKLLCLACLAVYLSTFCDIDSEGEGMDVWRLTFLLSVILTVKARVWMFGSLPFYFL